MGRSEKIKQELLDLVDQFFEDPPSAYRAQDGELPLVLPSYGAAEVKEAIDSLLSSYVTMGAKVAEFERVWAEYLGATGSLMVNSGSSANLLALSALTDPDCPDRMERGAEIITPAVTWSTTVFPISQVGAKPVLVDIDPASLTIDVEEIEAAITPDTRAIMPVHLLGHPAQMDVIQEIAEDHDLLVVEDCCEAHGAELDGQKVGTFGDLGTYSFFFSHHITTMEGGALNTDRPELLDILRSLRAHGWTRERKDRKELAEMHPQFDDRFLFVTRGYNLRPTEVQGAFGIHQVPRLETIVGARQRNAEYWRDELSRFEDHLILPAAGSGCRHAWFGFALRVRSEAPFSRDDLSASLERAGVETRPIMAGNFADQPAFQTLNARVQGDLEVSRDVSRSGFFIGNHHAFGRENCRQVVEAVEAFIDKHT